MKKISLIFIISIFFVSVLSAFNAEAQNECDANDLNIEDLKTYQVGSQTVAYDGLVPCGKCSVVGGVYDDDGNYQSGGLLVYFPCQLCHLFVMIKGIVDFILFRIIPIIAVLLLVYGGIMYVVSTGNPGTLTQAKSILKATVIGLVIIFASWVVINSVFMLLGIADWTGLRSGWFEIDCSLVVPSGGIHFGPPLRISDAAPTGELPVGTTRTSISIVTNRSAACRYSDTSGSTYDSMANTFGSADGVNHTALVTGLTNDTRYTYYAGCYDESNDITSNVSTISFGVEPPPPLLLSNVQPSGTLPMGTVRTTLSITTNRGATCRYSNNSADTYNSMINTFSTTDNTNHTAQVTGLNYDVNYNYYAICHDDVYVVDSSRATISFSIAPPPLWSMSAQAYCVGGNQFCATRTAYYDCPVGVPVIVSCSHQMLPGGYYRGDPLPSFDACGNCSVVGNRVSVAADALLTSDTTGDPIRCTLHTHSVERSPNCSTWSARYGDCGYNTYTCSSAPVPCTVSFRCGLTSPVPTFNTMECTTDQYFYGEDGGACDAVADNGECSASCAGAGWAHGNVSSCSAYTLCRRDPNTSVHECGIAVSPWYGCYGGGGHFFACHCWND